jgi:hypothetical protein
MVWYQTGKTSNWQPAVYGQASGLKVAVELAELGIHEQRVGNNES